MLERLLCGEYSVGKICFAEILMITPLGIPLMTFVGEFDELHWGIGSFAEDDLSVVIS